VTAAGDTSGQRLPHRHAEPVPASTFPSMSDDQWMRGLQGAGVNRQDDAYRVKG